jgi:hypothetical protein
MLTPNKGFGEWGELLGDPVIATAILTSSSTTATSSTSEVRAIGSATNAGPTLLSTVPPEACCEHREPVGRVNSKPVRVGQKLNRS